MLVETLADYSRVEVNDSSRLGAPLEPLRLTLDIGHLYCNGETPLADHIRRPCGPDLANVHIEDMLRGRTRAPDVRRRRH